jgi:N,N'-diacetyllegionaminate synthase
MIDISASFRIGAPAPAFIIAEAGINHNGSLDLALKLVDAAVDAKANAIKFQTFRADRLVSPLAPLAEYQARNYPTARTQLDMLKQFELQRSHHGPIRDYCLKRGIIFLSTPFEEDSADFLEQLDIPAFKIPSGEITNLPFLRHVARKKRPVLLSTGMANLQEVETAVNAVRQEGNGSVCLFHCTSNYPAAPADANLRAMATMRHAFSCPTGYSDHTLGIEISLAAVAMGAEMIEKHVTLDKTLPGPDHVASLDPIEMKALLVSIRGVEAALGDGRKEPTVSERNTAAVARKSLHVAVNVRAGAVLERASIDILRPGTGISPAQLDKVVGRRTVRDLPAGSMLDWADLS